MRTVAYTSKDKSGWRHSSSIQLLWNIFVNIQKVEGLLLRR